MKRISLVLCALILIARSVQAQTPIPQGVGPGRVDPQTWKRYTVKGEEFAVALPILPTLSPSRTQTRPGKYRRGQHLNTSLGGVFYRVDIYENPEPQSLEGFIGEQNIDAIFDRTTERNLTINGIAGKEYSSREKTPSVTVQFFATERRLYRFTVVGVGREDAGARHFFSSIVLGKDAGGIEVSEGRLLFRAAEEEVFVGRDVDVKARLLTKPEPSYTENARKEEISGTVVLKAVFSATGEVTNIRVVSGLPHGLTEQAIKAARMIKFIPAMKDGKAVSMWIQLEYNFDPNRD